MCKPLSGIESLLFILGWVLGLFIPHWGQGRSILLAAPAGLWASANSAKHLRLGWRTQEGYCPSMGTCGHSCYLSRGLSHAALSSTGRLSLTPSWHWAHMHGWLRATRESRDVVVFSRSNWWLPNWGKTLRAQLPFPGPWPWHHLQPWHLCAGCLCVPLRQVGQSFLQWDSKLLLCQSWKP